MSKKINSEEVPESATDYVDDGFSVYFYKRVTAFNMQLLEYWNASAKTWDMCGTLPWSKLKPVSEISIS